MNLVKQFFKDLWKLPKHEFGRNYLLLPAMLTFLCFSIWLTSLILTPLNYLTRTSGTVASMDSVITGGKNKLFYKRVDKDLRIYLVGQTGFFKVSGSSDFNFITSEIRSGSQVTIYADPPFETFLFGRSRRICQLEHNGEIIINFDKEKKSYYPLVAFLIVITVGFGSWYFHRRRKAAERRALTFD